ncbi:hypothetical protein [Thermococcus sp. JCM 11816]|uniref:hypothetical protein n=1 Tax=Thermococcus sp. (strain JCM 11816 / KS-1) TaxID=1295125 RepID=UPI00373FE243
MTIMDVFLELALILVVAKLFGYLTVRLGFPAALGQLIGGILIGPSILGIVSYDEAVRLIGGTRCRYAPLFGWS